VEHNHIDILIGDVPLSSVLNLAVLAAAYIAPYTQC